MQPCTSTETTPLLFVHMEKQALCWSPQLVSLLTQDPGEVQGPSISLFTRQDRGVGWPLGRDSPERNRKSTGRNKCEIRGIYH